MPSRASFAAIGLAYLENAILDALVKSTYRPEHLARMLGLYPNVRFNNLSAGNQIVRAILAALEQEKRVRRCSAYPRFEWELTVEERSRRSR